MPRAITVHRFERLETALVVGQDEIRCYMKVLHEDTLSHIALLGDAGPTGEPADYLLGVSVSSVSPKSARSLPATIAC